MNKNIHKSGRPTELTTHNSYITYTYDSHGRVLFKTKTPLGKDGKPLKQSGQAIVGYRQSLQLYYNANHELIKSIKIKQTGGLVDITTTTYQYDAFGRRIAKHSDIQNQSILTFNNKRVLKHGTVQHTPTKKQSTFMLWDGNRQIQEQTDTHVFTTIYEQNSFEPVARLVWLHADLLQSANDEIIKAERESWEPEPELIPNIQVYHYHNDHLGTPNELTNQDGEVVWLADYEAWGNTAKVVYKEIQLHNIAVSADELQPLRFQGQFIDQETGLHYNRFRYYDPDLGMFTTRDPIGLLGGNNVFQYAPNPIGWVDPWGLNRFKPIQWQAPKRGTGQNYKVYQQDIDWDQVDSKGRTNLQRTAQGRAPLGSDGKPLNLHHSKQDARGSLFELTESTHSKYGQTNALHPYKVNGMGQNPYHPVDRDKFNKDRAKYWRERGRKERIRRRRVAKDPC